MSVDKAFAGEVPSGIDEGGEEQAAFTISAA